MVFTVGISGSLLFCHTGVATQAMADSSACPGKPLDFPVVDFHAHTFNFRHLPLRGILYGWGVPDLVAGIAAEIIWGMTRSYKGY